tara:strand:- start:2476 stop:3579 length:1104 start_codon:yes stop_codon:yes gene_type:complete
MHTLITGSEGFVGKNLTQKITEQDSITFSTFDRSNSIQDLKEMIPSVDYIIHLAGSNRPKDEMDFNIDNFELTKIICDAVETSGKNIPIIFSSSIHAESKTPYGRSKKAAEQCLLEYAERSGNEVHIFRIPNIFGKWCKPNYNSVVATFCYNIVNNIPIEIHDKSKILSLVYIDDVIEKIISSLMDNKNYIEPNIEPIYKISLGELSEILHSFKKNRETLLIDNVGTGLKRALYATYISYLDPPKFSYELQSHTDERGIFAEFLKTIESGQFSFFTAHPNVTRGGHYHHTKNEKFLVVSGSATFKFKNILTNEKYTIDVSSDSLEVVETIPGWVHDITNTGKSELLVLLWANEVFDPSNPDTFMGEV